VIVNVTGVGSGEEEIYHIDPFQFTGENVL
jgi:hypothetical protein